MLKVVDVIGLASTGAYEGDASLVTRTKIVRIARLGSGRLSRGVRVAAGGNTPAAEHDAVTDAYVCRLLPLICLAPDLVEAMLDGPQPKGLRPTELAFPFDWDRHRSSWRDRGARPDRRDGYCAWPVATGSPAASWAASGGPEKAPRVPKKRTRGLAALMTGRGAASA